MSIVLIWVGLIFKIFPSKFSLRVAGVSVAEFITVRFQPIEIGETKLAGKEFQ